MVNFDITRLVTQLEQYITNNDVIDVQSAHKRKQWLAAVIGAVVALNAELPSARVINPRLYYSETVYGGIADYLNTINESYAIDIDAALNAAYLVWMERYSLVYPSVLKAKEILNRISESSYTHGKLVNNELFSSIAILTEDFAKEESQLNVIVNSLNDIIKANK